MLFFVLLQFFFNLIVVIVFVLFWGNQVRTAKCILSCRPTATLPIPLPLDSTADHVPWPRDPNSISGCLAAFTRLGWCPGCGVPPTQAMPCVPCGPATLLGGETVPWSANGQGNSSSSPCRPAGSLSFASFQP